VTNPRTSPHLQDSVAFLLIYRSEGSCWRVHRRPILRLGGIADSP